MGCVGPQTRSQRDRADPLAVLHLAEKASWTGERPQFWSKTQVLEWISYQVEKNKYDASSIDFSRCDMDGATLCSCALEDLRQVFGPLGDQLHAQLRDLSKSRPGSHGAGREGGRGVGGKRMGLGQEGTAIVPLLEPWSVTPSLPASARLQLF